MWGVWVLVLVVGVTLGGCQDQHLEYIDYDYVDVAIPEANTRTRQSSASAPSPGSPPKPRRPGSTAAKKSKPRTHTTPVPIIKDIRRVDPNTGAFYYHYEGGDGSMKHEVRFPNGTVYGNFTFVKDNGELETRTYHHGMGSNVVENDNGDYELHRHLEQPYVHQSGPDPVEELFPQEGLPQPNQVRIQSHQRPVAQQSRPVSRNRVRARPRPVALEQTNSFTAPQPVPLDFHDSQTSFSFHDEARPLFGPNTVNVDHQAQGSELHPVVEPLDYDFQPSQKEYVLSQDHLSEPVQVSEQ